LAYRTVGQYKNFENLCLLDNISRIIQKKYEKIQFYPIEFTDHETKRRNKIALERLMEEIDDNTIKRQMFNECVEYYNKNCNGYWCEGFEIPLEIAIQYNDKKRNIIKRKNSFLLEYAETEFTKYLLDDERNKFIYATSEDGDQAIIELDNRYSKSYRDRIERRARFLQWNFRKAQSVLLTLTIDPKLYNYDKYQMWIAIKKEYNRFITNLKYHFKKIGRPFPRYLSTIEAQKGRPENNYVARGNPHLHIVFFGVARLMDWTKIRDIWKNGHIWINRSSARKKIRNPVSYIMKYICKTYTDTNKENKLTQSLCWLFNKRSFQCSRNLIIPLKPKNEDSSYYASFLFIVDDEIPIEYFRLNPWICEELTNPANYKYKDRRPRILGGDTVGRSRYNVAV